MNKEKKMISADSLKWIALITMFIDHIGAGIFEKSPMFISGHIKLDLVLRAIGRTAFPIFCFLLVEGYFHTRNRLRYGLRLFVFCLLSEIPFDLLFRQKFFTLNYQNVYFTLIIGYLCMIAMGYLSEMIKGYVSLIPQVLVLALGAVLAQLMHTDYGAWGVVLIGVIFLFSKNRTIQCIASVVFMLVTSFTGLISDLEAFGALAFIAIAFYSGQRKNSVNKYFFYSMYPIHLSLYAGIRYILFTVLDVM
ncbi:MAG: conjugal transfer protein TraX [Lachnospiraceae bacterium]|nr:conjugal transfer protein TraX [Lachnospiraceae bacterium]